MKKKILIVGITVMFFISMVNFTKNSDVTVYPLDNISKHPITTLDRIVIESVKQTPDKNNVSAYDTVNITINFHPDFLPDYKVEYVELNWTTDNWKTNTTQNMTLLENIDYNMTYFSNITGQLGGTEVKYQIMILLWCSPPTIPPTPPFHEAYYSDEYSYIVKGITPFLPLLGAFLMQKRMGWSTSNSLIIGFIIGIGVVIGIGIYFKKFKK